MRYCLTCYFNALLQCNLQLIYRKKQFLKDSSKIHLVQFVVALSPMLHALKVPRIALSSLKRQRRAPIYQIKHHIFHTFFSRSSHQFKIDGMLSQECFK